MFHLFSFASCFDRCNVHTATVKTNLKTLQCYRYRGSETRPGYFWCFTDFWGVKWTISLQENYWFHANYYAGSLTACVVMAAHKGKEIRSFIILLSLVLISFNRYCSVITTLWIGLLLFCVTPVWASWCTLLSLNVSLVKILQAQWFLGSFSVGLHRVIARCFWIILVAPLELITRWLCKYSQWHECVVAVRSQFEQQISLFQKLKLTLNFRDGTRRCWRNRLISLKHNAMQNASS